MPLEYVFHPAKSVEGLSPITQSSGVCFDENGRILLLRQGGKHWNLPGGTIELGESLAETLAREIYEETTVRIGRHGLIGYQEVWEDGKIIKYQARFACLVERIDPMQPDPSKGKMHERMFVEPARVMDFIPFPHIEQIINEAVTWYNSSLEIMEKEILLWETNCWRIILHSDQKYLGRAVIVLKRDPCGSLSGLLPAEWLDLSENVIPPYESAIKKALGAELFNWSCLMNLAYQNTPPDPHVHWHVKPRYRHPIEIGGVAFVDEKFGHHYEPGTTQLVSTELMEEISSRIQAAHNSL